MGTLKHQLNDAMFALRVLKRDFAHMSSDQNQWQNKVELMLSRLKEDRQVMTYLEMAEYAEIPSPYRIHQLAEFLEGLVTRDIRLGQPIMALRVVSKRGGIPADGFFDHLAAEGVMPQNGESRADFYQRLCEEAG